MILRQTLLWIRGVECSSRIVWLVLCLSRHPDDALVEVDVIGVTFDHELELW